MIDTAMDEKDARIQELEEKLHPKHERFMPLFGGLTQQQAKLLALLMEVPVADSESIRTRVDASTEAKVMVHRLRMRMKGHDIGIEGKRFHGFWMEPGDKDKVRTMIDAC